MKRRPDAYGLTGRLRDVRGLPFDGISGVPKHLSGQRLVVARRMVIDRDGETCRRCGGWVDVTLSGLLPDGPTLGHIIPLSKGGTNDPHNLGLEHARCNLAASDRRDPPRALIATPIA